MTEASSTRPSPLSDEAVDHRDPHPVEAATTAWLASNDEYLSRYLSWLRLVLERAAERSRPLAKLATEPPAPHAEEELAVMSGSDPGEAAGSDPGDPAPRPMEALELRSASGPAVIQMPATPVPASRRWHSGLRRRAGAMPQGSAPVSVVITSVPETTGQQPSPAEPAESVKPPESAQLPEPAGAPDAATPQEPSGTDLDARIAAAAQAVHEAAMMDPPPALERIAAIFGLTAFEHDVLLLCVAPALDTGLGRLIEQVHGTPWPTFGLAMAVFDDPAWDAMSPDRPLRRWQLTVPGGHAEAMTAAPLMADERIVNAVKGLDHLDERLASMLEPVPPAATALPPSQQSVAEAVVSALVRAAPATRTPLIQLVGARASTRSAVAVAVANAVERDLFRLDARRLPVGHVEIDLVARLWYRESVLAPVALFLDEDDRDDRPGAESGLPAFFSRSGGLLMLGGRDVAADLPVPSHVVDVATPTAAEQRELWRQSLGTDAGTDVGPLVGQFDLDGDTIVAVARLATQPGQLPDTTQLWDQARHQLRPRLESVAPRLKPLATWDSLVLPDTELALLRQVCAQVAQRSTVYGDWGFGDRMNRGLGISALFSGESGTGKSMAAEVIANELRLDLYRIDLSSVVSKYIGETEKNLSRLFDAAEDGGVILFFDEADALFGRRSEVKDAHDRYANIEVNFLLQRMEAYRGLAILATNMPTALDRAFTRRLRFIVTFPFPRQVDRLRMWERAFPAHVPLDTLDLDRLSRLDLTGAGITNTALNAAFLAAVGRHPVGMADVLSAARDELRKLRRPVNEAAFRLPEEVRA